MRRSIGVSFCAVVAGMLGAIWIPTVTEADPSAEPPRQQGALVQEATVVKTVVKRPRGVVHRRVRFRPPAHPPASFVFSVIVPHEAKLWGANEATLRRRIACESGGHWWANNGQYNGVGQFASGTFFRGLRSIGTRRVTIISHKIRRMHSRVYRVWTDGHIDRHRGRVVRQVVVLKRRGRISTSYTDAWTQTRIMARANAGLGGVRDSEWECR